MRITNACAGIVGFDLYLSELQRGRWPAGSMVMVARGASRNVRIVRMYPLTILFTFTMVIINSILGLMVKTSMQLYPDAPYLTMFGLERATRTMLKHSKASERM